MKTLLIFSAGFISAAGFNSFVNGKPMLTIIALLIAFIDFLLIKLFWSN